MNRRLYFLFPDEEHARHAVDALPGIGVAPRNIHAITKDEDTLKRLPKTTPRQRMDLGHRLEWLAWSGNLGLFGIALIGFVVALVMGNFLWAMALMLIMIVSFISGFLFSQLPDVGLNSFKDAMAHGEIVLMLDVHRNKVKEVEDFVHHHYPEAAVGGVSWSFDALGF